MSAYSTCGSACVTGNGCGAYRPAFSLPNPVTRICERCQFYGCAVCDVDRCIRCRESFILARDGLSCVYELEKVVDPVVWGCFCFGGTCAVGSVICFFMCHKNTDALQRGLEHRHRCAPRNVETVERSSTKRVVYHSRAPLFSLTTNVHTQNIVGVGLALYYNHLVFVAGVAVVSWLILGFMDSMLDISKWSVVDCGYGSSADSADIVVAYARRRCLVAVFLWACLMPGSLVFARWQATAARRFDRDHTRMEDYVLSVRNLPTTATDPWEIQLWFEALLGRKIVGVSIGYQIDHCKDMIERLLDDHLARREAAFLAALGVPTAADNGERGRGWNNGRVLPVLNEGEEYGESDSSGSPLNRLDSTSEDATFLTRLRSSGEAFLVMRKEEDVETLFALWDQPNRLHRTGSFFLLEGKGINEAFDVRKLHSRVSREASFSSGTPLSRESRKFQGREIELREVTSEPTSVIWDHMGTPGRVVARRGIVALIGFLALIVVLVLMIFFPLTDYVVDFSRKAGQVPSSWQTIFLGFLISAGNTFIAYIIYICVPRLGFKRKDQEDILCFLLKSTLVLSNTLALVTMTARKLSATARPESGILTGAGEALERSEELGMEVQLADMVFNLFLSGSFVFSTVSFLVGYPAGLFLNIVMIKTGFRGFDITTRDAERLMEPDEIWLPWDYASHIQLPCCAFAPLFLAEPPGKSAARTLCVVLFFWTVVMYCAQRIIHLRHSRETFFSTARLDTAVLYAWGLPLGQLALTAAYWAMRACMVSTLHGILPCFLAFGGSCCVYWLLLHKALQHQKNIALLYATQSESYEAALARLRYSYFNTNPVYVLMSDHLPGMRLPRSTWYQTGKTHLQTVNPKADAILEATHFAEEQAPSTEVEGRSAFSRLLYQARVWINGAPKHVYASLDNDVDDGMISDSHAGRW
eukprot:TRINITY_DN13824_c0_g1_i1.p1 TRINITY_DN13824_c0_g1~~TRINITY_DN13824_c0_g1_i1.p1  ORF type:complete len:1042 (+),score=119.79 TRINITY_DN13824_c0_g1_i1:347-3127(+)